MELLNDAHPQVFLMVQCREPATRAHAAQSPWLVPVPNFRIFRKFHGPTGPQILEEQSGLLFHLQQQQVIELIRAGRTEAALDYAQEYLAPRSENNPNLLLELGGCGGSADLIWRDWAC